MILLHLAAALGIAAVSPPSAASRGPAARSQATRSAARRHLPARAKANLASYLSDDDYPAEAIRNEEQGTVQFTLHVTAEGAVGRCEVIASSGSAILDGTTCRIMVERVRFEPARDARGRAVPDRVTSRLRWVLPQEESSEPPPVRAAGIGDLGALVRASDYPPESLKNGRQGSVGLVLLVAPNGTLSDCTLFVRSGTSELDEAACRIMKERARFTPARDAAGAPTWDVVPAVVTWQLPH
jgi:TonB family protein